MAQYFPSYGPAHGYIAVVGAAAGWRTVCTYGIDTGGGANSGLGCRSVYVDPMPFGALDAATPSGSNIRFSGWAIDPDTAGPISVYVTIDGVRTNIGQASQSRPDVGAYFPAYGPGHGYSTTVPATAGQHAVCAYALNVGDGSNVLLRCTTVTV